MLKPSSVLSFFFYKKRSFALLLFGFLWIAQCCLAQDPNTLFYRSPWHDGWSDTKGIGNFLQDEIFDPYLRASCGVNLDRGGGQLGSNMSSSTATGKFEIVRLSDCQIVRHSWRVCWCISAHISRGQGDLAGRLCDPTISLSTHFCNIDSHACIESSLDERVPPIDGRERSQVAVWSLSVWFEFSPGWTFCNDSLA